MKKSKFAARLLSAAVAMSLCLGLAVPAFAASLTDNGKATITKTLQMDTNVTTPDVTFTYHVAKVSLDDDTSDTAKAAMPGVDDLTVAFSGTDTGTTAAGSSLKEVEKTVEVDFTGLTFPHAGVYKYTVTEAQSGYTEKEGTELAYSQAEYTVEVYVENDDTVTPSGLKPTYVVVHSVKDDGGNAVTEAKSDLAFASTFKKNGGNDDNAAEALKISKAVDGSLGDKTKEFTFTLTLTALSALEEETASYTGTIYDKDGNAVTGKAAVTLTKGTEQNFTLKDGEYLAFENLPAGTQYTVAETDYSDEGYTTTISLSTAGAQSTPTAPSVSSTVSENTNAAAYTNTRAGATPTGIIVDNLPFFLLILAAVLGLTGYVALKRRKYRG